MTMNTTVVNTTSQVFILKEGTAGVYRLLKRLQPKDSYIINVDPNATYREYFCAVTDNDPDALILSSDDCQEYDVVRIKEKTEAGAPSYFWDSERRDAKRKAVDAGENRSESTESIFGKIVRRLTPGFFRKGNPQT